MQSLFEEAQQAIEIPLYSGLRNISSNFLPLLYLNLEFIGLVFIYLLIIINACVIFSVVDDGVEKK